MKQKTIFLTFVFIGLITMILVACHPVADALTENNISRVNYKKEITAARKYYESWHCLKERAAQTLDARTESGVIANMEPLWSKKYSYCRKTKEVVVVETVMQGNKHATFMLPEVREKFKETKDIRYKQSMTRLVVETNIETGGVRAFTMTIIPSLKYLEMTNFNPFANTYLKLDKHFEGRILFHEVDGQFANGWVYSDGKITHTIKKADISVEDYKLLRSQPKEEDEDCEIVGNWILGEE